MDLNYLIDSEIINIPNIQSIIEMKKRQELLDNHPYKIWCGSNGKWYTYLPDEEKGRILKKRNTKKDIEDVITFDYLERRDWILGFILQRICLLFHIHYLIYDSILQYAYLFYL